MQNDDVIEMKNITKRYPGVAALDNIQLQVKRGEVHALLGENGAGKSTLIKILAGAIHPDEGEIWIEGKAYSQIGDGAGNRCDLSGIQPDLLSDGGQ